MQDRATDLLPAGSAGDDPGDGAYEHVRARVQALISAARDLSDTCADLADALRPLPGHDDAGGPDFGRLRAERTAALLDEAASAARGTLGLLHSAYSALERKVGRPPVRGPAAAPRVGESTWPDAFVELPPRTFTVEDEAGTAPAARWAEPATSALPAAAPAPGEVREEARTAAPGVGTDAAAEPPVEDGYGTGRDESPGPGTPDSVAERSETTPGEAGSGAASPAGLGRNGGDREADQGTDPGGDGGWDAERPGDWPAGREDSAGVGAADQRDADVQDADLGHADLGHADLGHADLRETDLRETDLRETDLRETDLRETDNADSSYDDQGAAEPRAVDPLDADPRDADVRHEDLGPDDYGHTDPHHADLGHDKLGHADLGHDKLGHADPHHADQGHDKLGHEDLGHDDTRSADLGYADPSDTDLGYADPRDTDLGYADVRDTDDPDLGHAGTDAADLVAAHERDDRPGSDFPDLHGDDRGTDEDRYGTSLAGDRESVASAAFAGWVALDPDDEDAGGRPILGRSEPTLPWRPPDRDDDPLVARAVAAEQPTPMLTLPVDPHSADGHGWHGDTVSPEPRSLSLVPPVPEPDPGLGLAPPELAEPPGPPEPPGPTEPPGPPEPPGPTSPRWYPPDPPPWRDEASDAMPAPDAEPWAAAPRPMWQPVAGLASPPVWTAEAVPGAGDGLPVHPLDTVDVPMPEAAEVGADADVPLGQGGLAPIGGPLDDPGAAVIARQVEAARRHLQAALVVANQPAEAPRLGALLTAVERVLTAVTDLARETRGVLEPGLTERTFPGEARFLCSQPWERTELVGRDGYGDDVASPSGLAKLLRSLGYEATSITSAGGVAGVHVRSERYAAHIALVEVAGGGRQRWSGALEWTDASGASRTWAETLGPVELEDEELARRVDELLRRCVGAMR